jgi:CheY-like chemotaxis protein
MARIVLIHWHEGEGAERARLLEAAGHRTVCLTPRGGSSDLRALRQSPPDAFVIDLSRLPSQGCAVAVDLRRQKATRPVPIVFAGGEPEKVGRIRKLLPDATYTEWGQTAAAVRAALASAPAEPTVPSTMDIYAGASLPKKLGIRPGLTVALLEAPEGFERKLDPLPEGAEVRRGARGRAGLVLLFAPSMSALRKRFPAAKRLLAEGGSVWIAWPKKASGVATDLGETAVRAFGLAAEFVDYKVCSVDETWSGLLFTRRSRGPKASNSLKGSCVGPTGGPHAQEMGGR